MNSMVKKLPKLENPDPLRVARTPSQDEFFNRAVASLGLAPVLAIVGGPGSGKTTLAKQLAHQQGGNFLDLSDATAAALVSHELRADEAIGARILHALEKYQLVIVDDLPSYTHICTDRTRGHMFREVVLPHIYETAERLGRQLVVVGEAPMSWEAISTLYGQNALMLEMPAFTPADYASLAGSVLGQDNVSSIDFNMIHRHASMLNCAQLRFACTLLKGAGPVDTAMFVRVLETWVSDSNIDVKQVEELDFEMLPGSEEIIAALETHVSIPFQDTELGLAMGLKPKRGVLLYGPPGTGKTSIGRTLARQMKGKFFMIDGTFVTEPPAAFFAMLGAIVAQAKASAPSVLFIDDADVLFEVEHISGLTRFLLTLLDGLESETASNVCVMMTAMDVRKVPAALIRSGRVELWLETRPPVSAIRTRILQRWLDESPSVNTDVDLEAIAAITEGFTPADLRRLVDDAKLIYGADYINKGALKTSTQYLSAAVNEIVTSRNRMAEQSGDPTLRIGAYE